MVSGRSIAMYLSYVLSEWSAEDKLALFVVVGIGTAARYGLDYTVINASSIEGIRVETLELYIEP